MLLHIETGGAEGRAKANDGAYIYSQQQLDVNNYIGGGVLSESMDLFFYFIFAAAQRSSTNTFSRVVDSL